MPLLVRVDPHDLVAEVLVLAADVGVGVVDVVVGVLPRLSGRGRVPVPGRGVDLRVVHPVPLAVQDVVADLHVLEDLRRRQAGGPERARRAGSASAEQHDAAITARRRWISIMLGCSAVALAEVVVDLVVDRLELLAELLDLLVGEVRERALDLVGLGVRSRSRGVISVLLVLVGLVASGHVVQSSISTWPSGALTQVRTISPSLAVDLAGAQVADLARAQLADAGVADAHPAAVGQVERRPPRRRRGSACRRRTRPRRRCSEPDRAALAVARRRRRSPAGSAPCAACPESASSSQCSLSRVEHARRARRGRCRARASRGRARRGRSGVIRPLVGRVCWLCSS